MPWSFDGVCSAWLDLDLDALVVLVVVGIAGLDRARFLPCGFVEACFSWFKEVGKTLTFTLLEQFVRGYQLIVLLSRHEDLHMI